MIFDFSLPNNFAKDSPKKDLALPEGANGLVVHCCCAPCSTSLVECLIFNKIKPLMFFYNPNIYPLEEYEKRSKVIAMDESRIFCERFAVELSDIPMLEKVVLQLTEEVLVLCVIV